MGWVEGPLAECADLMGLTPLIYALYDEPGMVREMLGICLESALACARAQARAGADVIGVGDAVASVLGPAVYREFALPYEQRLFEAIASEGAVGRLHICGDIAPLLADIRRSGARVVDVDWMVGFGEARAALEGAAVVCGNFDPVRVVRDGTPEDVGRAVRGCLVEGGGQCLVMAGCEIPQDTPPENLAAVGRALGWAPHAPWPL
jgi:MtaA/CmuA family methyltransferase